MRDGDPTRRKRGRGVHREPDDLCPCQVLSIDQHPRRLHVREELPKWKPVLLVQVPHLGDMRWQLKPIGMACHPAEMCLQGETIRW